MLSPSSTDTIQRKGENSEIEDGFCRQADQFIFLQVKQVYDVLRIVADGLLGFFGTQLWMAEVDHAADNRCPCGRLPGYPGP